MKKVLSLLLTLAILGGSLIAFADIIVDEGGGGGGFGDNNIEVEDTLDDEAIEAALSKPLYFNDFENCTFGGNDNFKILDSGDTAYGKAIKAKFNGAGAACDEWIGSFSAGGTYQWNNQNVHTFNEPIEKNTDYILAIDYKNTELETANSQNAISFAAQVNDPAFKTIDPNDFYHYIPVNAQWNTYTIKFNSSTATSMNMKINFAGSTATTWIDNYGIYEPVKLTVNGMDVVLNITKGIFADGYLGKGAPLTASAPEGLIIDSATMGGRPIKITDGKIDVSKVTGDIVVNVARGLEDLRENHLVKNGVVYVPKGQAVAELVAKSLSNEDYVLTNSQGYVKPKDGIIYPGDKLAIKVNATDYKEFTFKYIIDTTGSHQYVVSDVVYILDCLLGKKTAQEEDDLNRSGKLTVSDLVLVRKHILTAEKKYTLDETKLAAEKTKVIDDVKKYGIPEELFDRFITNVGNRSRIANVMKKALRGENITIATIGGSITEGVALDREPVGKRDLGWASLMGDWWKRMFPGQVAFVNAGISGTPSIFGNYRLEDDVLCHDPDLLFVEFAVDDDGGGGSMRRAQESMIRRMLESGGAAVQIFFRTADSDGAQNNYQPVGKYYDIPQLSPRNAFWGTYDFSDITYDDIHPNVLGNAMVATLINNYLNSVYESLNEISSTPNVIPEKTFEENTPAFMTVKGYDAGKMTEGAASADGKVTIKSYGDFIKNTNSNSYYSNCDPMFGVKYSSGTMQPIVIDIDDCHVFGILSETATSGATIKVEVYKQGTEELLKTDNSVDTNYGNTTLRSHNASFESAQGVDVTVKITPIIESGRTTANLRTFYIF